MLAQKFMPKPMKILAQASRIDPSFVWYTLLLLNRALELLHKPKLPQLDAGFPRG
jgi:hypothetical protein